MYNNSIKNLIFVIIILISINNNIYSQNFTEINITIPQINGNVSWGDFDNDNDLDILISGQDTISGKRSRIYRNDGLIDSLSWQFTKILTTLPNANCNVNWSDFDNDGDLDILLNGDSGISDVFINDGPLSDTSWNFIALNTNMRPVHSANAVSDYDNDGDIDILISGANFSGVWSYLSLLYRNDGNGLFNEFTTNIDGVSSSAIAWGDFDKDKDMDLFISGYHDVLSNTKISKIYRNNGKGIFNELGFSLPPVDKGTINLGDFDDDGDLDFILAGTDSTPAIIYKLYRNDGSGSGQSWNFTEINANLSTAIWSCAEWADFDNDGDLDLFKGGWGPKIYRNDGPSINFSWNFININANFFYFGVNSVSVGDFDNDNDLDVLISGYYDDPWIGYYPVLKLYRNNNTLSNTVPNPPNQLNSIVIGDSVILNWNNGSDNETATQSLTYNLRIGSTPSGCEILSPMSDDITGYRRITKIGNCNHNNSWYIKDLDDGIYYWSVQTVDHTRAGSVFSVEETFVVSTTNVNKSINHIPNNVKLYDNFPNPFNSSTKIKFSLDHIEKVKIEVFNLLGQRIEKLIDDQFSAGSYEINFKTNDLPSGIYLYRIKIDNFMQEKKMLLLR